MRTSLVMSPLPRPGGRRACPDRLRLKAAARVQDDHLRRADAFEAKRTQQNPVRVEILSNFRLEALVGAQGATWLDRELVAEKPEPLRESGFGVEVMVAKTARRTWLVEQGLAAEGEGGVRYRRNLLTLLRQRELASLGERLDTEFSMPSRLAETGDRVSGLLHRRVDLASGRFGLVEGAGEMVLVPWRPEMERQLGRALTGRVGPAGFSWSAGRGRGIEVG